MSQPIMLIDAIIYNNECVNKMRLPTTKIKKTSNNKFKEKQINATQLQSIHKSLA